MGVPIGIRVLAAKPSWYDPGTPTTAETLNDPANTAPHPVVRPGWTGVVLGVDPANPTRAVLVNFSQDADGLSHYIFAEGLVAIGPIPNLTNPEEVDAWLDS